MSRESYKILYVDARAQSGIPLGSIRGGVLFVPLESFDLKARLTNRADRGHDLSLSLFLYISLDAISSAVYELSDNPMLFAAFTSVHRSFARVYP